MDSISELAARWAVRKDAGQLASNEERDLAEWLNADPRHLGAYIRARAQWLELDRFAALNGPTDAISAAPVGSSSPTPPAVNKDKVVQHAPLDMSSSQYNHAATGSPSKDRAPLFTRRRVLAASVAAVVVTGGGLSWMIVRGGRERYISGIGEVRRIALVDGSTVILNTDTEVSVQLARLHRDIELIRGEALFEVAHDTTRPFIVMVNGTTVRAVGTAFAVRLDHSKVDVTVTEGVVEVSDRSASDHGPALPTGTGSVIHRVSAHERVVISPDLPPQIESVDLSETNRQLAWREGMVSFDGETLSAAVAEINRHNRRQIVIDDPVLGQRSVVGVFRATDLEGFTAAAAAALKARAVPDGDVIHLQDRAVRPLAR